MSAVQQSLRLYDPARPEGLTVSDIYRKLEPQLPPEMSPRSKVEHRTALSHWVAATGDPPAKQIDSLMIAGLRDYLVGQRLQAATINKVWRTLRSFLRFAAEELHEIPYVPSLSYKSRSKLVKEPTPVQRENITHEEIEMLWRGCLQATYPAYHDPRITTRLWRTFIVLIHTYGMRSGDLIDMPLSAILWKDGLIRWAADKTDKLQGLPLTECVKWHLKAWLDVAPPAPRRRSTTPRPPRLFEGLCRAGHHDIESDTWSMGYYTTWRREIAVDVQPEIHWQNFRDTAVTEFNDVSPGVGGWVAAHSETTKTVTARHYDKPDRRIREAFAARPVPECFLWEMQGERLEARGESQREAGGPHELASTIVLR
jgi:integrase